ncbi:MAG: hypothetical protein EA398_14235 [Deltaproteobacteria bacterium]|nr:MAG: hypothetical protein EA398_14235 [Deltaproteobacteria bacterium]
MAPPRRPQLPPLLRFAALLGSLLAGAILTAAPAGADPIDPLEQLFRDAAAGLGSSPEAEAERGAWRRRIAGALLTADDHHAARLHYRASEFAERDGDLVDAITACGESLALDPSGRFAHRCRARLRTLEARAVSPEHIAFHTAMDEVRRQFTGMEPDEAVARVEAIAAAAPDSATTALALEWLSREFGDRRADPDTGYTHAMRMVALPDLPPNLLHRGFNLVIVHGHDSGRIIEARRELDRFTRLYPEQAEAAQLQLLRAYALPFWLRPFAAGAAWASLVLFALLFVVRRGWRGFADLRSGAWRPWPQWLWFTWLFAGAGIIAEMWDRGFLVPFLAFIPTTIAVHLLGGALGRCPAPRRLAVLQPVITGCATLGALYLVGAAFRMHGLFGL